MIQFGFLTSCMYQMLKCPKHGYKLQVDVKYQRCGAKTTAICYANVAVRMRTHIHVHHVFQAGEAK